MKTQENCHAPGFTKYQKRVTIGGKTFWADPELIPLLKALNKAGLTTRSHCAGHGKADTSWVILRMDNIKSMEIRDEGPYNEVRLSWKKKG